MEAHHNDEAFPYCHPTVAKVLAGPMYMKNDEKSVVTKSSLQNALAEFGRSEDARVEHLVPLSVMCDNALFGYSTEKSTFKETYDINESSGPQTQAFLNSLIEQVRFVSNQEHDDGSSLVTVATLLVLNTLESTIRQATTGTTAAAKIHTNIINPNNEASKHRGSPLLKDMIRKLEIVESVPPSLSRVCALLLLPHDGLNFRNLLWHGFVAAVPRPWFSLVVVLTQQLQSSILNGPNGQAIIEHDHDQRSLMDLREYPELQHLLNCNEYCVTEDTSKCIEAWVQQCTASRGHIALCRLGLGWMSRWTTSPKRPATVCAILSVLLEHCLRLLWCKANNRPSDMISRPGAFYVTMDGHGQRHVHDLLLHPYISTDDKKTTKNLLVWNDDEQIESAIDSARYAVVDDSSLSLLMDLFCTPFGPNIRASIAHGKWNHFLVEEWDSSFATITSDSQIEQLWDHAHLTYIALARLSNGGTIPPKATYSAPIFTFAQQTRRNAQRALTTMTTLAQRPSTLWNRYVDIAETSMPKLQGEETIKSTFAVLTNVKLAENIHWLSRSPHDEKFDFELNQRLSSFGASRSLLEEVANALENYRHRINNAIDIVSKNNVESHNSSTLDKRRRKTSMRFIRSSETILTFYKFALWVALDSLDKGKKSVPQITVIGETTTTTFELVKRTRMVLSTVDSLVDTNLDRAIRAIVEFTKSKALNEIHIK